LDWNVAACTVSAITELARWSWQERPIKKWIGHSSEEMVNLYTHLRPEFMRDELGRVPDFTRNSGSKIAEIDHFDPEVQAVA
jgi:hypothetical protein